MKIKAPTLAAIAFALVSTGAQARDFGPSFDDLGKVDIAPATNHCWILFKGGRVGIASGPLSALLVETDTKTFDESIEPSIGKQIYAHRTAELYNALIVGMSGMKVTIAIDLAILGDILIDPYGPIDLYPTRTRQPAKTPRLWTGDIKRQQYVKMLECHEANYAD